MACQHIEAACSCGFNCCPFEVCIQTKVIKNKLNPNWNESFDLLVHDKGVQVGEPVEIRSYQSNAARVSIAQACP